MTRADLIALAARVEQAQGPDRWLDGEIWRTVNGWAESDGARFEDRESGDFAWLRRDPDDRVAFQSAPPFTASLDAALTLVPKGWRWSLDHTQRPPYRDCGRANLYAPGSGMEPADVSEIYAATPALALCAAALRARAEDLPHG